jgi:cytochrome bd ubiquinol oxidase subunit I
VTDLLAARTQMATSLGFHIVFAEIGIAMPLMMLLAEWRWRRTGERAYLDLAHRWAKGTAVLFAVGAVSGTVLSFELGLLWPGFMRYAGALIGMPFSLEGFAFFLEAIFLGIYLYGWERVGPRAHLAAGAVVALSGAASAVFVVMANAWMNTPTGYTLDAAGGFATIDPIAAMRSPAAFQQALHMLLAAYAATGMAVAGVHAFMLLRGAGRDFHLRALTIALLVGAPAAVLQPLSGDLSARVVARTQPVKLAALEGQWATERGAPLRIGGWPDAAREETRWALEIPYGLSLLAFHDPYAEVKGLRTVVPADRPPVAVVHLAFQTMVGLGTIMALVALWAAWSLWRRRALAEQRELLRALVLVAPFGFVATEAGWIVTEVGRQPWVVQGLMRTSAAVTPMPGLVVPMLLFTLLYLGLGAIVVALITSLVRETARATEGAR